MWEDTYGVTEVYYNAKENRGKRMASHHIRQDDDWETSAEYWRAKVWVSDKNAVYHAEFVTMLTELRSM